MLSSYANVVEKLHRDLEKTKATLLKIERAGDVLLQAVSSRINKHMEVPSSFKNKYFQREYCFELVCAIRFKTLQFIFPV